jgi:preprotein translocase subunit SecG
MATRPKSASLSRSPAEFGASIGIDVRRFRLVGVKPWKDRTMRRTTFLLVIYLVIGVVVAYAENYLENVDRTKRLISAALAIVLWPLVLVGFDVQVT